MHDCMVRNGNYIQGGNDSPRMYDYTHPPKVCCVYYIYSLMEDNTNKCVTKLHT